MYYGFINQFLYISIETSLIRINMSTREEVTVSFNNFWNGYQEDPVYPFLSKTLFDFKDAPRIKVVPSRADIGIASVFGTNPLDGELKVLFLGENWPAKFSNYDFSISHLKDKSLDGCKNLTWPLFAIYFDLLKLEERKKNMLEGLGLCAPYMGESILSPDLRNSIPKEEEKDLSKGSTEGESSSNLVEEIKDKFCCFVVSNPRSAFRNDFFSSLSKYKRVDSGGKHLNNIGYLVPGIHSAGPIIDFISQYRFCISFENSEAPGYCTEKIVQSMWANTIPIYWGDPEVTSYFNPKSFVLVKDKDEALRRVMELDRNETLYQNILKEPWLNPGIAKQFSTSNFSLFGKRIIEKL